VDNNKQGDFRETNKKHCMDSHYFVEVKMNDNMGAQIMNIFL